MTVVSAFPKYWSFYIKVFYVMGKALTGELSCPVTGLVLLTCHYQNVRQRYCFSSVAGLPLPRQAKYSGQWNSYLALLPFLYYYNYIYTCWETLIRYYNFPKMFKASGPSCSKLLTLFINETINFQTCNMQRQCYFLWKNCWGAFALQKLLIIFQQKIFAQFSAKNNNWFYKCYDLMNPRLTTSFS